MSLIERPSGFLDDFYRPFGSIFGNGFPGKLVSEAGIWQPSVDIKRVDGAYVLEVEVPGMAPEEVEVEAHDSVLTIQGQRETENEETEDNFVRRERSYGSFVRRFTLPKNTDADAIEATVKNGVLEITIPDGETAAVKKISVE